MPARNACRASEACRGAAHSTRPATPFQMQRTGARQAHASAAALNIQDVARNAAEAASSRRCEFRGHPVEERFSRAQQGEVVRESVSPRLPPRRFRLRRAQQRRPVVGPEQTADMPRKEADPASAEEQRHTAGAAAVALNEVLLLGRERKAAARAAPAALLPPPHAFSLLFSSSSPCSRRPKSLAEEDCRRLPQPSRRGGFTTAI